MDKAGKALFNHCVNKNRKLNIHTFFHNSLDWGKGRRKTFELGVVQVKKGFITQSSQNLHKTHNFRFLCRSVM